MVEYSSNTACTLRSGEQALQSSTANKCTKQFPKPLYIPNNCSDYSNFSMVLVFLYLISAYLKDRSALRI